MGRHRKPESTMSRRTLLSLLVGGSAAAGVSIATSGRLYTVDELHRELAAPPSSAAPLSAEPVASTTPPTTSQSVAPTSSVAPPTTTTVKPAPTTTAAPKPQVRVAPSLESQLRDQPRSGWGLSPAAAAATHLLAVTFGVTNIGGYRASSDVADSDHPKRLAADFMTSNQKTNRAIGNFAIANRKLLRVKYVISLQHYNDGRGWTAMEDRGSATANHFDHCHVSFY